MTEGKGGLLYVTNDSASNPDYNAAGRQRISVWQLIDAQPSYQERLRTEPLLIGQFTEMPGENIIYHDGSLYFITPEERLARYDLKTHEAIVIPQPDPTLSSGQKKSDALSRIEDLWLSPEKFGPEGDTMLFVLQGSCGYLGAEDLTCLLFERNMRTGDYRLIANVPSAIGPRMGIAFGADAERTNIPLKSIYGDAGYASGNLTEVDEATGRIVKTTPVSFENCDAGCDAKVKAANDEYERLVPSTKSIDCSPWRAEEDWEGIKLFFNQEMNRTIADSRVVACLNYVNF